MRTRTFVIGILCASLASLATHIAERKILPALAAGYYEIAGDVNGDGNLTIGDAIYLLNHMFAGGPAPAECAPCAGGVLATGHTQCYGAGGAPIDCGSASYPGQDGFYRAGAAHSYTDNGDGTVTDTVTGLEWAKAPSTNRMTWQKALQYCDELTLGGKDDWRLPNINELASLLRFDRAFPTPAIDPALVCPAAGSGSADWRYWSSSCVVVNPVDVWYVSFDYGVVYPAAASTSYRVRAVRGGL